MTPIVDCEWVGAGPNVYLLFWVKGQHSGHSEGIGLLKDDRFWIRGAVI